jgi:exosortase
VPSIDPRSAVRGRTLALIVLAAAVLYAYHDVIAGLARQWAEDENYSHGFLVPPLAAYFAWTRRSAFAAVSSKPTLWGLVVVAASLALLAAGVAAAEPFVSRLSLLGVVAGSVLFLAGFAAARALAFPIAFLLLMIPPPEIVFNQVSLPLQLFASRIGEEALRGAGIAVLRDGNVLELATLRLEVAEACSGIRSIVALVTFALLLGELGGRGPVRLGVLAALTVPIAVVMNAGRVAATGVAASRFGPEVAAGVLHTISGLVVFGVAAGALVLLDRLLARDADIAPPDGALT